MINYDSIATVSVAQNKSDVSDIMGGIVVYSLDEAVKLCAELRKGGSRMPIAVKIFPGEYELPETLYIGAEIRSVRFESFSGNAEDVIISGATKKAGRNARFNGTDCLVSETDGGISDLYVGKRRAYPTRFPETGYFKFADVENRGVGLDDVSKWVVLKNKDVKDLAKSEVENATLNFLHYWVDEHTEIESFDKKSGKLVMKDYSRFSMYGEKTESVYYLTNVKSAFGERGRCFFDNENGKVYYVPRNDEKTAEMYLPRLYSLIDIAGTPDNRVKNLSFKNLTFAYTRGDRRILREDGVSVASDGQAAAGAGGTINIRYAENCTFSGCTFRNYGLYGVNVAEGCSDIVITESVLKVGGAGGVKISGADGFGKEEDRTHSVEVSYCGIEGVGRRYMAACGILIGHAYNNRIVHNEIYDLFYSGISVGWVWGYKESITKNNYIAYNRIYDLGKGVLSDMGGVYLLGPQEGTTVAGNLIYNVRAREYGGWAIYADEGCSYITVENNVCYDCSENCFHQHYGKMNVIRNNLFFKTGAELCRITRGEMHLSAVFENNVFVADNCAVYGFPAREHIEFGGVQTRNNVICSANGKDITVIVGADKKYGFRDAEKLGFEKGSVQCAAKVDVAYDGTAALSGDKIYKCGFIPTDISRAGIKR